MPNDILSEISASSLMTITLNALANGSGRQTTLVTNASPAKPRARVFVAVMSGSSAPNSNSIVEVRLISGNGQLRSDLAGASDAAYPTISGITLAKLIGTLVFPASTAALTDQLIEEFVIDSLGIEWGIAVVNRCGQALGTNRILTPDFSSDTNWTKGTGWTIAGGLAVAAAGSASDLSQATPPLASGRVYLVTYTVSGRTAGTVVAKCGTQAGTTRSADGTYTELIVANGTDFLFTKDASFDGDLDNVTVAGNFVVYSYENAEIQ